jgi:transposase-like protein
MASTLKDSDPRSRRGQIVYVRKLPSEGGNYTYKEKSEAAAVYLATGNWSFVEKQTGISRQTLYNWRKQPWWTELINDMQIQEKVESNKTLSRIKKMALSVVEDRLDKGNVQYDQKTGKFVRVPVGARDAHRIASDLMDKEDVLQDRIRALGEQENKKSADALKDLMAAFTSVASSLKEEEHPIIDVTPIEETDDGN